MKEAMRIAVEMSAEDLRETAKLAEQDGRADIALLLYLLADTTPEHRSFLRRCITCLELSEQAESPEAKERIEELRSDLHSGRMSRQDLISSIEEIEKILAA